MADRISRRGVLKAGLAVAGTAAATGIMRGPQIMAQAGGPKLRVAVVGAGGMGGYALAMGAQEKLVALVDVDDNTIAAAMNDRAKGSGAKVYHDYRKMLDECHKELDVVLISTPDHHHAPAAIRAIDLGKHVFAQKPLAHNIYECYALAKAAKEKKVLTQMGNQGYCGRAIRRVSEYVQAGAVGHIVETHTVLGRNFGGSGGRPASKPVPPHLHWDEWLGPAPYREYHDGLHPFDWRSWKAFGTGTIGDMACHHVAVPFMALKLGQIKAFAVECINTKGGSDEMYPQDNIVCYHIPARGDMPPCKCYVYDHHDQRPAVMLDAEKKYNRKFGEFTLFVGDKGLIGSDSQILPREQHEATPAPAETLPRAHGGPIEDLYWCIRNDGTPASNFITEAGPLTAIALAGHLAQFAGIGKKVEWDVEKMRCTNMPEINKFVKRDYRKGWEV